MQRLKATERGFDIAIVCRGSEQEESMFRRIPWQDVCKFLAGTFFETSGILIYLWLYRIPIPIFNTGYIQTPEIAGFRSIVHTVLFFTFFYLGFIRKWKDRLGIDRR